MARSRWSGPLGVMSAYASACLFTAVCLAAGCSAQRDQSSPVASDWPETARAATYSPTAKPGFDSPESVTALLEQRWPLVNIRAFCIPERRHNPMYQNLVVDSPEAWKGRLWVGRQTGFDRISWYSTVRSGRLLEYSLGVYRGHDYWLLEIGSPETNRKPPQVTPDPSAACFIGHR